MSVFDLICCRRDVQNVNESEEAAAAASKNRAAALMLAAKASAANPASVALAKAAQRKTRPMVMTRTGQARLVPDVCNISCSDREAEVGPVMAVVTTGAAVVNKDPEDSSHDKYVVEAFEKLAARLEGEAQKYPKSGTGVFTNPQNRYFAAQPADDTASAEADFEDRWEKRLQQWRRGRLAWWKDKASFMKRDNPKGSLALMSISKVTWDLDQPQSVTVRHMEEKEKFELVIKFSAEDIAKEWKDVLGQIRKLLRRTTLVV
mmetsp:Transcript_28932/g.65476  ORF Transcript_28932/g.65476 Transcript_28932/m.65476 type:complete len:261 (+) Transcript_28932:182-964(+)